MSKYKGLFTYFDEDGINEVHVDKVLDLWNKDCFISQYHKEFCLTLIEDNEVKLKTIISQDQALELIEKLSLVKIQNYYDNAWLYQTKIEGE